MARKCSMPTMELNGDLYYIIHKHPLMEGLNPTENVARRLSFFLSVASDWSYIEKGFPFKTKPVGDMLLWLVEQNPETARLRRNFETKARIMHERIVERLNAEEGALNGREE